MTDCNMDAALAEPIARMLNALPNEWAITLRYRSGPVSIERAKQDLRALHARIDRGHLGRHFNKAPVSSRSLYWAVAEDLHDNPHVHTAWIFPDRPHALAMLRFLGNDGWEGAYSPGGSHDVQVYDPSDNTYGRHGWATYALKAMQTCNNVIISDTAQIAFADRLRIHTS